MSDLKGILSSVSEVANQRLYAFRVEGFHEAFTPDSQKYPNYKDKKVQGLKLMNVWENKITRKFSEAPTAIYGWQVVVLNSGIAHCPADVDPFEVWKEG